MDEKLIESLDAKLRRLERLAQQILPLMLGNGMPVMEAREMLPLIEAGRAELVAAERRDQATAAKSSSSPARGSELALGEWQRKLPDESGLWWWWNEDEDSLPLVVGVAYSGTSDSHFAMQGQHGWTRYQDVEEMGGWWRRLPEPEMPTQNDLRSETAEVRT